MAGRDSLSAAAPPKSDRVTSSEKTFSPLGLVISKGAHVSLGREDLAFPVFAERGP